MNSQNFARKQEFHFKEAQNQTIIQELRKQVEQLLRNQGSNNITYNTNIVLNAFGKENTSYISKDYILSDNTQQYEFIM